MVADSPHMTYVGKNFGDRTLQRNNENVRYYLGILDEGSGKMRVVETSLFNMLPNITDEDEDKVPDGPSQSTYVEKFGNLVEAFGSKKKKQSFEKKHRNKLDEVEVKGFMSEDVQHGTEQRRSREEEKAAIQEQLQQLSALPVCNKEASRVELVYPIEEIVTSSELDLLQSFAENFFNSDGSKIKEWRESDSYSSYVLNHLSVMPMEETLRWNRSKLLTYLDCMIKLHNCNNTILNSAKLFPNIPSSLKNKLFDNFTVRVGKSRCKPSRLKDRLAAFILVLCLHIDEFTFDLDNIAKDLRIGVHRVQQILRAMGCSVVRRLKGGVESYDVKLALPLDFPRKHSKNAGSKGARK
ncbi:uncharacterized protein LOC127878069 isoform X2 [Dreissena polymorpha]|nr:uncharacterized protein LOC127878069 isoform X2 [Dreissena polymorpha]